VRGRDCSCEAETAQGGDLSCKAETTHAVRILHGAETCHARQRLLEGGPSSRELVGDAPHWSGMRRLASDGLDRGPQSSS
jgi:hypothetical protein